MTEAPPRRGPLAELLDQDDLSSAFQYFLDVSLAALTEAVALKRIASAAYQMEQGQTTTKRGGRSRSRNRDSDLTSAVVRASSTGRRGGTFSRRASTVEGLLKERLDRLWSVDQLLERYAPSTLNEMRDTLATDVLAKVRDLYKTFGETPRHHALVDRAQFLRRFPTIGVPPRRIARDQFTLGAVEPRALMSRAEADRQDRALARTEAKIDVMERRLADREARRIQRRQPKSAGR